MNLEPTCPAQYRCIGCGEDTCVVCDLGQPDCPHAADACNVCREEQCRTCWDEAHPALNFRSAV